MRVEIDTVVVGDCLDIMFEIKDKTFDLIFLDPPYNASKNYGEEFNDNKPIHEDYNWLLERMTQSVRTLKPGGTLWLMNATKHIGFCQTALDSLELEFRNMIAWVYAAPTPAKYNLPKTWRPILFYSKGNPKHLHPERLSLQQETIYCNLHKTTSAAVHSIWPDIPKLVGGYLQPPEVCTNIEGKFLNVTQLPEALLERIILLASNEEDTIFDPFLGTGTTVVVANKLNRHYYGCDINPLMIKITEKRLNSPSIWEPDIPPDVIRTGKLF